MDTQTPATPDAAAEALAATAQPEGTQPETPVTDEPQDVEPKPQPDPEDPPKAEEGEGATKTDDDKGDDDDETNQTESRNQRRRRLAREREAARTKELETAKARITELEAKLGGNAPRSEDFDTDAEYTAALASYNVRKELDADAKSRAEADVQRLSQEARTEWEERAAAMRDAARSKYSDFDQKLEVAAALAQASPNVAVEAAIQEDDGADLAYWLGNNPAEAREIMSLPPYQAAIQLGRISASLPKTEPKTTTSAPPPLQPVKPKASAAPSLDEIDDMDEYAKRRGFNL